MHGELQVREQGSSMHRNGVLGAGLEVLGTVGVRCGSLGYGLDGVMRGAHWDCSAGPGGGCVA